MTDPEGARPPGQRPRARPRMWEVAPATFAVAVFCGGMFLLTLWRPGVVAGGAMEPNAVWNGQVWRLVTSLFLHGGLLHVAFNVGWWTQLGVAIEVRMGSLGLLVLTLLTGIGGSAAEMAGASLTYPGSVGLSGAVYGIFFFGFVALRPLGGGFAALFSKQNAILFAGWGVLCVVLTWFDLLGIANLAHGMGALLGALIGWATVRVGRKRTTAIVLAVVVTAGVALAAWRPVWLPRWHAWRGEQAFIAQRWDEAAEAYERVARRHPEVPGMRANQAFALFNAGRYIEAEAAALRISETQLSGFEPGMRATIEALQRGEAPPPESLSPP